MIQAPNTSAQLIDPDTGLATTFLVKWLQRLVDAFGVRGSVPWDPGAIAAGATASIDIPLPNAAAGQLAGSAFSQPTAGIVPLAFVSAAGTATALLWNTTAGTVTPTAGTVTVLVWTP